MAKDKNCETVLKHVFNQIILLFKFIILHYINQKKKIKISEISYFHLFLPSSPSYLVLLSHHLLSLTVSNHPLSCTTVFFLSQSISYHPLSSLLSRDMRSCWCLDPIESWSIIQLSYALSSIIQFDIWYWLFLFSSFRIHFDNQKKVYLQIHIIWFMIWKHKESIQVRDRIKGIMEE